MMQIALLSVVLPLLMVTGCLAEQSVIKSWDFAGSRSAMGWEPNDKVIGLNVTPEGLTGKTGGEDPYLTLTGLDIPADALQCVEIEMRTDGVDEWQLFWSNSSSGEYQGFLPDAHTPFVSRTGDFHTYRIFPLWHAMGRIVQLRLDPPQRRPATFTIKSIKIVQTASIHTPPDNPSWTFTKGAEGWLAAVDADVLKGTAGWRLHLESPQSLLLAPMVDFSADEKAWATVVMSARKMTSATLMWATADGYGMRGRTFAVEADGKRHVYNIEMAGQEGWHGRIVAVGLGAAGGSGSTVTLDSVSFSDRQGGPAEVRMVRAWTDEAILREGETFTLRTLFENTGGQLSSPVKVSVMAEGGIRGETNAQTVAPLMPGEIARKSWTLRAMKPGKHQMRLSWGESARVEMTVYPALPSELRTKMDYVPVPNPVSTGDYLVGCYYYPGWNIYGRWSPLEGFPERWPVLGFYREGDPEVADWHIKWAVEHGIGFWIYDWYWSDGTRSLDHALHKGFFNARYHNMMKFCLLWANHNKAGTSSLEDMENVTRYWIDNYFKRDDYLKIDGKPVMVIFSARRFTDDMGVEGTRKALERSREMCREAGLPGIYFVAVSYPGKEGIEQLQKEGYDALTGYNYPSAGAMGNLVAPYSDMVKAYPDYWKQIDEAAAIPYIPVTEPGWDSRPWHGDRNYVRTGKTPELFEEMLRSAKAFEDAPGRRKLGGRKMVFIEAWNEFGEGDYIEPHHEWGFGHVDAIRQVFSDGREPHVDVTPKDVGLGPYEVERSERRTSWEFTDSDEGVFAMNMKEFGARDGALCGVSANGDPAYYFSGLDLQASRISAIEIRLRVSKGQNAQLYWAPTGSPSEARTMRFPVTADGQYHVYRLNTTDQKMWTGTVRTLRIDPTDAKDADIALDYVRPVRAEVR